MPAVGFRDLFPSLLHFSGDTVMFLKCYGDCEGPLGFPMFDREARALDELLKRHPGYEYQRAVVAKAATEFNPGERADVSWISTEALDRQKEIVLASGFDDAHYRGNPIVTLNHDYEMPPVGRSLWRKRVRDGATRGIKAKTVYPPRPDGHDETNWPPDQVWALVKAGLLTGKSVGFLRLAQRGPTDEEVARHPAWADARNVVEQWSLVEYCCTWLPVNPECITDAVSKSLIQPDDLRIVGVEPPAPPVAFEPGPGFTTLEEMEVAVRRRFQAVNLEELIRKTVSDRLNRLRGRV
jgi:hypothetical protein